jgi:hypothetical protein
MCTTRKRCGKLCCSSRKFAIRQHIVKEYGNSSRRVLGCCSSLGARYSILSLRCAKYRLLPSPSSAAKWGILSVAGKEKTAPAPFICTVLLTMRPGRLNPAGAPPWYSVTSRVTTIARSRASGGISSSYVRPILVARMTPPLAGSI